MVMVMMMVVMVVTNRDNHLRLRRIGSCEAEYESQSKQNPFHILVSRAAR
jgi:hypothetical protein